MQSALMQPGRKLLIVLEPGDDVLPALALACREHGIDQAIVTTFSGALRSATLIASDTAPADPELPLPESIEVTYTEGIGSGTISGALSETPVVHIHVALGSKDASAIAVAGHLLAAEVHYVVEVAIEEVLEPGMARAQHPGSSGIPILTIVESPSFDSRP